MPQALTIVVAIAAVLLIGNLLILSHELGHYAAARSLGLVAERFTIGFGPNLVRLTDRRGTIWSLSALPLGGFVAFAGERDRSHPDGYAALPPPARMAIIAAGPIANLLVAVGLYAGILAVEGEVTLLPVVSVVMPDSAAAAAGIKVGDRVQALDGTPISTFADLAPLLRDRPGQKVDLEIRRGDAAAVWPVQLEVRTVAGRQTGYLGIESHVLGHRPLTLFQIGLYAPARAWHVVCDTVSGVAGAVTTGKGAGHFAGMLGVAHIAGEAAAAGTTQLLALTAVLSINLALMNLLPIPVLDGGAFLFCLIEWVRGRPASEQVQDLATRTGLATIAGLFALSTLHDLAAFGLFQWFASL